MLEVKPPYPAVVEENYLCRAAWGQIVAGHSLMGIIDLIMKMWRNESFAEPTSYLTKRRLPDWSPTYHFHTNTLQYCYNFRPYCPPV